MKEYKKTIVSSSSNFFVVHTGTEMIKLKQGMTQAEVISVLGKPYSISGGSNPKTLKLTFQVSKNNSESKWYEVLFTDDSLIRALKIKSKI